MIQATLMARPVPVAPLEAREFNYELRNIVAARYWPGHRPTETTNEPVTLKPDKETFAWLDGVMAGSEEGNLRSAAKALRQMLDDSPQGIHIWIDGPEEQVARERIPQRVELADHQMFGSGN